jgi:ketosteroid isomerase-like protein
MNAEAVAKAFTEMCKAGQLDEAGEKFWSPDVVSIEAMAGPMQTVHGIEGVRAKGAWWYANHEVHSVETHGPYLNGEQFSVRFVMDITPKATGQRAQSDEVGLYTVKDGKIVEERFFY